MFRKFASAFIKTRTRKFFLATTLIGTTLIGTSVIAHDYHVATSGKIFDMWLKHDFILDNFTSQAMWNESTKDLNTIKLLHVPTKFLSYRMQHALIKDLDNIPQDLITLEVYNEYH